MVKCADLHNQNVHINDNIQWNQTCVLWNDHLMYAFMYPTLVLIKYEEEIMTNDDNLESNLLTSSLL